ncbi:AraC family transcriptional regulator [Humisphaera borealis]|uniref:Helix-turn-helix domain-containing protein n=1 Tax=Humisphaera borealis TaxID=2807512 RepID=A0A7M2WP80_9BACT|nr:AraC family transcriptional regulator [Humisphaera borealis]QOV87337.1 helix-turn-helix domain-containing protein [Humisphaera borealis]
MSSSLTPINSPRYKGRFAIAAPEVGIPYLAEAGLEITSPHERHAHNEIQVIWVLEGDMGMEIGSHAVHVKGGKGLILLPDHKHRVVLPSDMARARSRIIDLRLVDDRNNAMAAFVRELSPHVPLGGSVTAIAGGADRLRHARSFAGAERTARMLSAVWDLLAGLSCEPVGPSDDAGQRRLLRAEQFMRDHLSDAIGVDTVAEHVGLSRSQLTRLMKRGRNMGPAELLRKLRVVRAEELLQQSTLSIKEISRVCGFASQHHFSRVFFASTGKRPTASR